MRQIPRDTEILEDVRRVRDSLGRIPTGPDYGKNWKFGLTTVKRRFGKWNVLLNYLFQAVVRHREVKRIESECDFCGKAISFARSSPRRFCSQSCSNKGVKRRKRKTRICPECGKEMQSNRVRCSACRESSSIANKKIGEYKNKRNDAGRYSEVRQHARAVARVIPDRCFACGYDKSVVVCHRIPIPDFPDDALVSEVNVLSNLVKLCRNHHWELDKGLLDLNGPVVQLVSTAAS